MAIEGKVYFIELFIFFLYNVQYKLYSIINISVKKWFSETVLHNEWEGRAVMGFEYIGNSVFYWGFIFFFNSATCNMNSIVHIINKSVKKWFSETPLDMTQSLPFHLQFYTGKPCHHWGRKWELRAEKGFEPGTSGSTLQSSVLIVKPPHLQIFILHVSVDMMERTGYILYSTANGCSHVTYNKHIGQPWFSNQSLNQPMNQS